MSLRQNFAWTLAGNVVYAGCQWGMLSAIAKLGSPNLVGQFALALAITAPVFMLTNLQLRGVQATDAKGEYEFADYLGLRLIMTALGLAAIGGIVVIAGYSSTTAAVIVLIALSKAVESLSDVYYGRLQHRERMDRISQSMVIKGTLSLAALGGVFALTGSLVWASAGLAGVWAAVLVGFDARSAPWHAYPPRFHGATLMRLGTLALPLGVVMGLISLNSSIPRYFIEHRMGAGALGIFAALTYLMTAGSIVVNALGQSASPRLARMAADGNRGAFGRLLAAMVALAAGIGVGATAVAAVAGPFLLRLLYTSEYAQYHALFTGVMAATIIMFAASMLGYGLTALRQFRVQAPIFALVTGVTAAGAWLLIPSYGLAGAVWAIAGGAAVQLGLSGVVVAITLCRVRPPETL